MTDLRNKIARALYDQDYNGVTRRTSDTAWLRLRDRTDEDSTWHRAADAVLAVLDLDAVRAEASKIEGVAVEWSKRAEIAERGNDQWITAFEKERSRADRAEAAIERVKALHAPFEWSFGHGPMRSCKHCVDMGGDEAKTLYPCPTIRALETGADDE